MAAKAYTQPGDSVLIRILPVYYPFSEVIQDNGRKVVSSNLYQEKTTSLSKTICKHDDTFNICSPSSDSLNEHRCKEQSASQPGINRSSGEVMGK